MVAKYIISLSLIFNISTIYLYVNYDCHYSFYAVSSFTDFSVSRFWYQFLL